MTWNDDLASTDNEWLPSQPEEGGSAHVPVLLQEAVDALRIEPESVIVDGTFGVGGHSRAILDRLGPDGMLIAFDRDRSVRHYADELAQEHRAELRFVHGSYAELLDILDDLGLDGVDGILLDLGLSSMQLADAERGFSFSRPGPLDMRFDQTRGTPASELLATLDQNEIAEIIFRHGEERQSRRIAAAIVREREKQPIETTDQLAEIVERAVGGRRGQRIHPATRTFQALRIAVNNELGELERGLRGGIDALRPGGRFAVIAFHSLEDRIVKQVFAEEVKGCICPPELPVCQCGRKPRLRHVGKPVRPTPDEVAINPRARSAIMRAVERLP